MRKFLPKTPKFLKYGAALMAGGFYIWAIIILFNNDNWIGISALTTMLLAIAAFWSIWQNRSLQLRERKERLLNEIIEWATESVKSAIYRQEKKPHELWKAILNYKYCKSKSEYVNVIATSFSTLAPLINDVVRKLDKVMKETTKYKDNKTDENRRLMRDCEDNLTKSVEKLFKEAAKIKRELLNKYFPKY